MARFQVSVLGLLAMVAFAFTASAEPGAQPDSNPQSAISASTKAPEKKSWFGQVGDRLASIDIKAKIKILDTELIDGLRASVNYKYEVEPSYDGEYHLRRDRGTIGANVNVGELLNHPSPHVGLSLNHESEFLYVRPFPSRSQAFKAIPYGFEGVPTSVKDVLERLPFTAENVIKNFKPGDFFSFSARMNIVLSASDMPFEASTDIPLTLATHYIVSGQYKIHLIKVDDNTIELKLIALRSKDKGLSIVGGYTPGLKILGLRVVDRRIEKITNLTEMFKASISKVDSNLNMAHYILDMRDGDVQRAYDGLTASVLQLKTLKITDPTNSAGELTDMLLSDITPFETIFAKEKGKPAKARVLDRKFLGKNDAVANLSVFKFAIPVVMKYTRNTEYYENVLTSNNPDGTISYDRLHTFQRANEISWWLSYYKGVSVSRASMVLGSDKDHKVGKVRDIAFEWDYRDKDLTRRELRMIKDAVRQLVPESIRKQLDWGAFAADDDFANARFIYKLILKPEVLSKFQTIQDGKVVAGWPQGNIHELLNKYIVTIPTPRSEANDPLSEQPNRPLSKFYTVVDKYQASIENIAYNLAKVVDPKLSEKEHADAYAELRFNSLFIEIGPGFITSLLNDQELKKWATFEISMTADDVPPMKPVVLGANPERKVYEAVSYIQALLSNNEFETVTQMMNAWKERQGKLPPK